jgi:hypothetical protein
MTVDFKIGQLRTNQIIGDNADDKLLVYTNKTADQFAGLISDEGFNNATDGADVNIIVSGSQFAVGVPLNPSTNSGVVLFSGDVVVSGALVANSTLNSQFLAHSSSMFGVKNFRGTGTEYLSNSFFAASKLVEIDTPEFSNGFTDYTGYNVVLGSYGVEITNSSFISVINAANSNPADEYRLRITESQGSSFITSTNLTANYARNVFAANVFGSDFNDDYQLAAINSFGLNTVGTFFATAFSNYDISLTNATVSVFGGNFGGNYKNGIGILALNNENTEVDAANYSFLAVNNAVLLTTSNHAIALGNRATTLTNSYYSTFINCQTVIASNVTDSFLANVKNSNVYGGPGPITIINGDSNVIDTNLNEGGGEGIALFNSFGMNISNSVGRATAIGSANSTISDVFDVGMWGNNNTITQSSSVKVIGDGYNVNLQNEAIFLGGGNTDYNYKLVVSASAGTHFATGSVRTSEAVYFDPAFVDADYTVQEKDHIILADTSFGPLNVTIPVSPNGRRIIVKDFNGQAATRNITVTATSASIDISSSSHIIATNFGSVTLVYYAGLTNWCVI